MTPEIKERAQDIAITEWGIELDSIPEPTRFDIVRRAIEDIRLSKLRNCFREHSSNDAPDLFPK